MAERLRGGLILTVLLTVVALQGCLLEEKLIRDSYSAVDGATAGVEKKVVGFELPANYCGIAKPVSWSGKITQSSPTPTMADLRFAKCLGPICTTLVTYTMSIGPDGTIPKQVSTFPGACLEAGHGLNVYFTPWGGNVDLGAKLDFEFAYNISDGDGAPRTLRVIVARRGEGVRAGGKVLIAPPGPDSECVLSSMRPFLPQVQCSESYDASVAEVTLTAVPEDNAVFFVWADDCAGAGNNPVCTLPLDAEGKTARAVFKKK